MKLLINTASTHKGGSLQVARSFIEECRHFQQNEYHIVLGTSLAKAINTSAFPDNFNFYPINFRPATRVFSIKSTSSWLKNIEQQVKPDIVFTTSGPAYWRPQAPHLVGYNLPHYVYPDSPFWDTMPYLRKLKWKWKGMLIRYFFQHDADAYVVQTDDIQKRLCSFLNTRKVYTVSNTCSAYYFQPEVVTNSLPDKYDGEFRFLTLSSWYPHKHLDIIPNIINLLDSDFKQRVRFILTLPDDDFKKNFPAEYTKNIINIGPVRIDKGPGIYRKCDAMFLPTLLECFSASYAEAMAMERPIITSDLGFARTVCGDAALYFDPMDPKDIAATIKELIKSKAIQQELVVKGKEKLETFETARSRAKRYLEICKELI